MGDPLLSALGTLQQQHGPLLVAQRAQIGTGMQRRVEVGQGRLRPDREADLWMRWRLR